MKIKYLVLTVVTFALFSSSAAFAQVERVFGLTISDPARFIEVIDEYRSSGTESDYKLTLLQQVVDGGDPSTHTLVSLHKDAAALEKTMDAHVGSKDFQDYIRARSRVSKGTSNVLAVHRQNFGRNDWREGDFVTVVNINVRDVSKFLAAHEALHKKTKIKMPGMKRVVSLISAGSSHAVLLSAPSLAELFDYSDKFSTSAEFAEYRQNNGGTQATGTMLLRVVKVWN